METVREQDARKWAPGAWEKLVTIGVHGGVFQADDVFSVGLLNMYLDGVTGRGGVTVIRTRDQTLLDRCGWVVDVGNVHDPRKRRFDHHQQGGAGERPRCNKYGITVPYSSFGLVWDAIGRLLIVDLLLEGMIEEESLAIDDPRVQKIWETVDEDLVQGIDGIDCGFKPVSGGDYRYNPVSVSGVISGMNPTWWLQEQAGDTKDLLFNQAFEHAVNFAMAILSSTVANAAAEVLSAERVLETIREAKGAPILEFPSGGLPWQQAVHESAPEALYVVFPSVEDTWMVQAVPVKPGAFEQRKPLPAAWAGLRDGALRAVCGVDDAVFCHNAQFIGGARTREGAMQMARLAVSAD